LKFSYRWLREFVPGLNIDTGQLFSLITTKTAECEGIEPVGGHFADIVAARVLEVEPMPKGKNKSVLAEIGGGKKVRVVCGALNVRPGMLTAWVPPGTALGDRKIGRTVIEGVESEGMLASAAELGINRDHSGLLELSDIAPGERLPSLAPDWIIEIDNKSLTHRPDLWGHYGMAREVAAITNGTLRDPVKTDLLPHGDAPLKTPLPPEAVKKSTTPIASLMAPIQDQLPTKSTFIPDEIFVTEPHGRGSAFGTEILDYSLCPRYSALVLENVMVGPSPLWLQARLESIGLNSINNLVDVTNYVLAELPQPMHAFDADRLSGNTIYVRLAKRGERLLALNGETYVLSETDLVIADASGPVALAGVIGGAASAISESTTRVVLESANFQAANVRLTSARHKLRTDASIRFEKSLDPENTVRGLARAIDLLNDIVPGILVTGGVIDNRAPAAAPQTIALPMEFVVRKLGKSVTEEQASHILLALGFEVRQSSAGLLSVTVPSWRATKDICFKDDLLEEIGRMIGYDQIVPTPPLVASVVPPSNPMRSYLRKLRNTLTNQGFSEAYNYSFVTVSDIERFHLDPASHIGVRNPIASELTHMRRSLLPGLFRNLVGNVRHYPEFRLFEIGNEVHPGAAAAEPPEEITHLAALLYSAQGDEQTFFEMKRVLECAFPEAGLRAESKPKSYEHPSRAASIHSAERVIGRLFELHPSLLAAEGIEGRAVLFDIDLRQAFGIASRKQASYKPLRKYPTSSFDLSVIAAMETPVAEIEEHLSGAASSELASMHFIRQYSGPPLQEGQKSVSYRLEIGALDHTLTSEEGLRIHERIAKAMQSAGFEIRGLE
jgi:phenylalanyl-tRNA synthetase beta chain